MLGLVVIVEFKIFFYIPVNLNTTGRFHQFTFSLADV
jgi:hypothetical protein